MDHVIDRAIDLLGSAELAMTSCAVVLDAGS